MIHISNRFLSPEFFRAISSMSIPDLVQEFRKPGSTDLLSKLSAAGAGPLNTGLALVNSPAVGIASSVFGFAPHVFHDPGAKGYDPMRVGQYTNKDKARGIPPLLKRAEGVAEQIHPFLASLIGYMDEPIKGLRPLGIFSVDKPRGGGSGYRYLAAVVEFWERRRRTIMPAKSEAQRKYLYYKFGAGWVKAHHFDTSGKLPAHVKPKQKPTPKGKK